MPQNKDHSKVLQLLGLAARAGRTVAGVELICNALKHGAAGKTPLVILEASDSSENSHKRITDRAAYYGAACCRLPFEGERIALAIGKRGQSVVAVGVTEPHLAEAITALLNETAP